MGLASHTNASRALHSITCEYKTAFLKENNTYTIYTPPKSLQNLMFFLENAQNGNISPIREVYFGFEENSMFPIAFWGLAR